MIKFFTYGIFLGEATRLGWGITDNGHYDTVEGYSTRGHHIVFAFPCKGHTLTGLVLNVSDEVMRKITLMEEGAGYKRITVKTTDGEQAEMFIDNIEELYGREESSKKAIKTKN